MKHPLFTRLLLLSIAVLLLGATGCSKRAKADRHLKRANTYFAADDYEKAEIEYINVLRLQSTNQTALRNLAEIYYADEMFDSAAMLLGNLRRSNTNDIDSRTKLARILLAAGAVKDARAEADFVLQRSATNEEALLLYIDTALTPADFDAAKQRLAAIRQKTGDTVGSRVAAGQLAFREKNLPAAEAEFKAAIAANPNSAIGHWALGNLYLSQGKRDLADASLKKSAELSPIRSARRIRYAALRAQSNDLDGANAILNETITKAPDYLPAWIYSARLALDHKQFDKAQPALDRVLRRNPNHFEAISIRSEMLVARNEHDKALTELDRLTKLYPKSAPAHYQLAATSLSSGDQARAITALDQALNIDPRFGPAILLLSELNLRKGDSAQPIAAVTELLKRDPNNYRAHLILAASHRAAGRPNEALAIYNNALKLFPNRLEINFLVGDLLREQGRLEEARKTFEGIVQLHPDDPTANTQLAAIDVAAKKYDDAMQRLQKWSERSPTNAEPVFQMAKIRLVQNDGPGAEALLEKVISMNPDAITAYGTLAKLYYNSGKVDAALEKSKLALARNPKDASSLLMSAMIHEERRDYNRARDEYEKLLELVPNNVVALNNLAVIYSERLDDLDKGYAVARKAEELRPNDAAIADTFGWIVARRGEYSVALPLLSKAAQGLPNEPEVAAHLGITQYMLGDETRARASLTRALQSTNTFNAREQAQKSLAVLNVNTANADPAAVSLLEKRLQEQPADPMALSRLATIYDKAGAADKAAAIYEKAIAANPKFALAVARLADITDQRLNNSTKAVELAKNARRIDPENSEIAQIAGRVASKSVDLKDQQWGLGLLQESSRRQPQDATIAYDLGWAYYTQGRFAESEAALKIAMAGNASAPTSAAAKRVLDFIPLSDPARAAQQLTLINQTLQADANYLPALAARAAAAQQSGDTNTTLKTLDQILARYPGFAPAIRSSAVIGATQASDTVKLLATATRARELFPDDPHVEKALGIAQYRRADYQRAARTLAEVARKNPNDEAAHFYLGMSHYHLKQPRESKAALKKAVELQPKAPFLAEAQRVLTELK